VDPYALDPEPCWAVLGSALAGPLTAAGARVLGDGETQWRSGSPAEVAAGWPAAEPGPGALGLILLTGGTATAAARGLAVAALARGWPVVGYVFDGGWQAGADPVAGQREWPAAPVAVIRAEAAALDHARLRGWTVVADPDGDLVRLAAALRAWARGGQ